MKNGVKKIISGGVFLFVAIIVPVAFVVPMFFQEKGPVLQAPGSIEISIKKPGKYVLWNKNSTVFEGNSYSFGKELPGGLLFSLNEESSGTKIPFQASSGMTVTAGTEEKASVGYFDVTNAGQYLLTITGNAGKRIFSFEKSMLENVGNFFLSLMLGSLVSLAAFIVALVLIIQGIIDLVRNSKSSSLANQAP